MDQREMFLATDPRLGTNYNAKVGFTSAMSSARNRHCSKDV